MAGLFLGLIRLLCRQLLRLQRGSEGGYFFPDPQDDFISGDFAGVGFVSAKSHFHAAFLPVSWAGNQTDGDAKQIRIGEHDAGAYVPVVIENLHACTLQLIIQGVSMACTSALSLRIQHR